MRYYILLIISCLASNLLLAQDLIPYRQNDHWGYSNASGQLIIPAKFDAAEPFGKYDLAIVQKAGKSGIIDKKGKYILPPKYRKVKAIARDLVTYEEGRNTTLMNTSGQVILEGAKWRFSRYIDYPHIIFEDQDKSLKGLLDTLGNVILPMEYTRIFNYSKNNNKAVITKKVERDGKIIEQKGLINIDGTIEIPVQYFDIEVITETTWRVLTALDRYKEYPFIYHLYGENGLIEQDYGSIQKTNNDTLLSVTNGAFIGFINLEGKEIIPCRFTEYRFQNENLLLACIKNNCATYNLAGEKINSITIDGIATFWSERNHLQIWKKEGKAKKVGIMNYRGEIIISPTFDLLSPSFDDNYYLANINFKEGLIDTLGNAILPFDYKTLNLFSENFIIAKKEKKYGIINIKEDTVLPFEYEQIQPFNKQNLQLFRFEKRDEKKGHNLLGIINLKGKIVQSPKYKRIRNFQNGYAVTEGFDTPNRVGLIDSTGHEIVNYKDHNYAGFYEVSEGMIGVTERTEKGFRKGYINTNGELVIPCIYEEVEAFQNGIAIVKKEGKYGVINRQQKFILKPDYKRVMRSEDYFYLFQEDGKVGLVDLNGKKVLPNIYSNIGRLKDGLRELKIADEKIGYVDENFTAYYTNDALEYVAKIKAAEAKAREGQIEETIKN